jgi:iron complex outermembrane receptor protein
MRRGIGFLFVLFAAFGARAHDPSELSKLDIDDLMNAEVTSVARRGQKLSDTPAAVFVITQDDIARSGATTIAEALRIVPGLDVASVDGNVWAISARGFNGRWANKLLVMVDGRSVYSPLFSGVNCDVEDTLLEDIDRIEVIRGPGGTLWGANAVDGIINIITKNSVATQGTLVTAALGTTERSQGSLRYGGSRGDQFHYRIFAKSFDREENDFESGHQANDGWTGLRAGLRADWAASPRDNVMLQGGIYRGTVEETVGLFSQSDPLYGPRQLTNTPRGGHVQLRWIQTQSNRSETSLQIYGDHTERSGDSLGETRRSLDVDFQHQLSAGSRNELVWGIGYRHYHAKEASRLGMLQLPSRLTTDLLSAFVQDEVRLPHNVRVTFGSKVQYDREYGAQFQPTLRLLWRREHQTFWGAVTHAVRTPSWVERDSVIGLAAYPGADGEPVEVVLSGSHDVRTEIDKTFELGYRLQLRDQLSLDITAFYEQLSHIINQEEAGSPYRDSAGRLIVPLQFMNADAGTGRGVEISATKHFSDRWDVSAGYSWLYLADRYHHGEDAELFQDSPEHQVQLRSFVTLTPHLELDTSAYFVDRLKVQGTPRYIRVDARLAWHPSTAWELSIVGQNLFDDKHREFISGNSTTPINRSVYGKVTWRF